MSIAADYRPAVAVCLILAGGFARAQRLSELPQLPAPTA